MHYFIQRIRTLQRTIGANFDTALTGVLFGQGKTNIFMFEGGFDADLDDTYVREDSELVKVLTEFSTPGMQWSLEPGSTLCFYDSRFFFLKFRRPNDSTIKMRWNLPTHVDARLRELMQIAQTPEEQAVLMQESRDALMVAQARMNASMHSTRLMADLMTNGAMNVQAASFGGTVITRYY